MDLSPIPQYNEDSHCRTIISVQVSAGISTLVSRFRVTSKIKPVSFRGKESKNIAKNKNAFLKSIIRWLSDLKSKLPNNHPNSDLRHF